MWSFACYVAARVLHFSAFISIVLGASDFLLEISRTEPVISSNVLLTIFTVEPLTTSNE